MVYILIANKSYKYDSGVRSHIIYIGTTGKGAHRPATSAVDKASEAFKDLRGRQRDKSSHRELSRTQSDENLGTLGVGAARDFQAPSLGTAQIQQAKRLV